MQMVNLKTIIILIASLPFTLACRHSDTQSRETSSKSIVEQEQLLLEAYKTLIKEKDSYVSDNNVKIFGQEFEDFNATIDAMEKAMHTSVQELVAKYEEKIDPQIIDNLFIDIKFIHKRYRLLYPGNYYNYSGKNKAKVPSNYFASIMEGSFNDPSLLQSRGYRRCVDKYLDILSAGQYQFQHLEYVPVKRLERRYDAIVRLDAHQDIKDYLIKDYFTSNIWTYRVEAFDYAYEKALDDVKNKHFIEEIKDTYQMGKDRRNDASELKVYRVIDEITLNAHIFYPKDHDMNLVKPAHVFFNGGSWSFGLPEWSYEACKNAAEDGRVAIAFDYRLRHIHGTDIKASVSDALAAIAWVRENSEELGIDPNKILAEGFSAGAHLSMAAAMIENPEDFGVKSKYSSKPNAVIAMSSPYNIAGRDVYDIKYDTRIISPLYLIKENLPAILAFHAEEDDIVEFPEFEEFSSAMQKTNNRFTMQSYAGVGHFFRGSSQSDLEERRKLTEEFMLENGF